jgi:hypothetical protein
MDRVGQSASCLLTAAILVGSWGIAVAEGLSQDGIDRNLLERQQRERDFHVRLYDAPPDRVPATTVTLPVPESFTKREAYDAPPAGVPGSAVSVQARPEPTARQQLDDSQLRRQLELQTQNKSLDDVTRQQQSQIQQLQFGRENQAQQLQQQIQRDSNASMQRLR